MDPRSFDALTRSLATGLSRRRALQGAFGGAIAAVFGKGHVTAQPSKVDLCHYDEYEETHKLISVSERAADAHLGNHDDFLFGDCCTDYDCADGYYCDADSGTGTCVPAGCPEGYVAVGEQCLLENGSVCQRTDADDPRTGGCASSRCSGPPGETEGVCQGCTNSPQCVQTFGAGYTCEEGYCVAPE